MFENTHFQKMREIDFAEKMSFYVNRKEWSMLIDGYTSIYDASNVKKTKEEVRLINRLSKAVICIVFRNLMHIKLKGLM